MKWEEIRKVTKVRCVKDVILPIEKLREKFPEREWTPPAVAFRKGEEYFTRGGSIVCGGSSGSDTFHCKQQCDE